MAQRKETAAYRLMKEWCDRHSFIPNDTCLMHFGGKSKGLGRWQYGDARKRLEHEGYVFEDMGRQIGYKVTRPPVDKDDEPEVLPVWTAALDEAQPASVELNKADIAAIVAEVVKALAKK